MTEGIFKTSVPRPLLLGGPTASGKSELAMVLARQLRGEIVSVDSMQVYRGLDIGTAKPSAQDRAEIPHHLIDVADPGESFDAAKFRRLACDIVKEVQARGRVPVLCGGTGLYFQAFIGGLGEAPPSDAALRAELEKEPLEKLLRELKEKDPTFFEVVDRQNPRRVIRAIEAIRQTGRPFSALRAEWPTSGSPRLFVCRRSAEDLAMRIGSRVDAMFARGLVDETKAVLREGLDRNHGAMQAIGYRQVLDYLDGKRSLVDTKALVKLRTRQFAKRQMTWFRKRPGVVWVDLQPGIELAGVAGDIVRQVGESLDGLASREER